MIKKLDTNEGITAEEIINLQQLSYKVEAELIGTNEIPPLKDTVDTIRNSDEIFYGYYKEGILVGLISYKIESDILDIYRVAVHPYQFRKGIAKLLIKHVMDINTYIKKAIVSTGSKNYPAINLYVKLGFEKVDEQELEKGIYLTFFEKTLS